MRFCNGCRRRFSLATIYGRSSHLPEEKYTAVRDLVMAGWGSKAAAKKVGVARKTAYAIFCRVIVSGMLCGCGRSRLHFGRCHWRAALTEVA